MDVRQAVSLRLAPLGRGVLSSSSISDRQSVATITSAQRAVEQQGTRVAQPDASTSEEDVASRASTRSTNSPLSAPSARTERSSGSRASSPRGE